MRFIGALLVALSASAAFGQSRVEPIVITATRTAINPFELPASVDIVDGETLRTGQPQVNLSETLARIPGINVQNRSNYAQDLQISSRGYGARASFGVRGIKVLIDGIPASAPDGAGQVASFALSSAERVEVLRGPFSALYGNASGGVIQLVSEAPPKSTTLSVSTAFAAHDTHRVGVRGGFATGEAGGIALDASRFETSGFRPQSAASRDLLNAKGEWKFGAHSFGLLLNGIDLPNAADPLGLTRAQLEANPNQTASVATQFNTRKTTRQSQLGGTYQWKASDALNVNAMTYIGTRDVTQFQSIAATAQGAATHPGGVIDLSRDFNGADLRASYAIPLANGSLKLSAGISRDEQYEDRKGFQNFTGTGTAQRLGVVGALKRDEDNRLTANDVFAQADWQSDVVNAFVGVRHSQLKMRSMDRFSVSGNPDDSGRLRFSSTTPVMGAAFKVSPNLRAYASAGRGFETPTFNEAAYRTGGQTGLNFDLKSATSRNYELGVKWRSDQGATATLAVFRSETNDEIAPLTNSGGRSVFRNVGRTSREGIEATFAMPLGDRIELYASANIIDATYRDAFLACGAPPCTTPNIAVAAGAMIPGVPKQQAFLELRTRPIEGLTASIEVQHQGRVFANDTNTESATPATLVNAMLSRRMIWGSIDWTGSVRVENIGNHRDAATVIVNEANGRFFEPRPPRMWTVALEGRWR
ncbi:MAG: TonB-dependent receptor [Betaproteobacteria bacterium]|nr:MAG: TonB-dependent receptor [Betaproteobacteria bacterium]